MDVRELGYAFQEGGWTMYAILAVLVMTLLVAGERFVVCGVAEIRNRGVAELLARYLRITADVHESLRRIDRLQRRPIGRIALAGIRAMRSAMEAQRAVEVARISDRTASLRWLATLAIGLGFLGTTSGLWVAGFAVTYCDASQRFPAVSAGIAEASNCLAFGVVAGIVGLLLYSLLVARTRKLVAEMDVAALQVLAAVMDVGPALRVFGRRAPAEPRSYRAWRTPVDP